MNTFRNFLFSVSFLSITCGCFTGSFEREVLKNFDTIVERSLPLSKVTDYYKQCPGSGRQLVLGYVTFFEERKLVSGHLRSQSDNNR